MNEYHAMTTSDSASPPAYEPATMKDQELFLIPADAKTASNAPVSSPTGDVVRKALIVELQLCSANGVTRPGFIRSGKVIKRTNDAITFTSATSYQTLRDLLIKRGSERGILPDWKKGDRQVMAMLVRPDGTKEFTTRLDETNWEAGRELLMKDGASVLFCCAVVDEGYEEKMLKREGRKCAVM